jgi:hypothetical protein
VEAGAVRAGHRGVLDDRDRRARVAERHLLEFAGHHQRRDVDGAARPDRLGRGRGDEQREQGERGGKTQH